MESLALGVIDQMQPAAPSPRVAMNDADYGKRLNPDMIFSPCGSEAQGGVHGTSTMVDSYRFFLSI